MLATVAVMLEPYDEGLGHSYYIHLDALVATFTTSSKVIHSEHTTTFWTISGASVSANTAISLSTALADLACPSAAAAAFESSTSFSFIPLQPVPRFSSGPLSIPLAPANRRFLSGSIERGFMSGPLNHRAPSGCLSRSCSHGLALRRHSRCTVASLLHGLTKGIARMMPSPAPRNLLRHPACVRPPSSTPPPLGNLHLVATPPPRDLIRRPFSCSPPLPATSSTAPSPARPPIPATFL